jgi:molecular chaperone GrpE
MQQNDRSSSGDAENRQNINNGRNMMDDINADENVAGTTHLNTDVEEENEVERLNDELQAAKDKYLRLFAEFDNYRKRSDKEKAEIRQTAGKEVIVSLLEVLDDCDRAESQLQSSQDLEKIREGVGLVFNKLRTVLQSKGLEKMESQGRDFNVEEQEAVAEIPAPGEQMKGKVIEVLTPGYLLRDKIIRFAKVIVGK